MLGFAWSQARPGQVVYVQTWASELMWILCAWSLAVLWGIGPAPAFRPVAEIRMVTNFCLLAHYAWDEDQEGLGSGLRASLTRLVTCMDKDTTPALSPAPEWWLLWQGDIVPRFPQ